MNLFCLLKGSNKLKVNQGFKKTNFSYNFSVQALEALKQLILEVKCHIGRRGSEKCQKVSRIICMAPNKKTLIYSLPGTGTAMLELNCKSATFEVQDPLTYCVIFFPEILSFSVQAKLSLILPKCKDDYLSFLKH